MKKLNVTLENCYGIKKFGAVFNFSEVRTYAIYAPNGAMKSSFAETFKDVVDKRPSSDRVFPKRKSKRSIEDESGVELAATAVMVIRNYEEVFGCREETSTLLVDQALREEYERLHADLRRAKDEFLTAMKEQSGSKKDLEAEISLAFTHREDSFFAAILRVRDEVTLQKDIAFADVPYDVIFNEKVLEVLAAKGFRTAIDGYVRRYNELLEQSTFFRKGVFNYWNASQIAKTLADNGFFDAKHSVNLNGDNSLEIKTVRDLEQLIAKEVEGLATDPRLRKEFSDLKKYLEKNVTVREFQQYISNRLDVLPQLAGIDAFRQDLFKSYFKARFDSYHRLLEEYERVRDQSRAIEEKARGQRTQWQEAIDIFNARFFVPFKLEAINHVAVMLGEETMLTLGFTFEDGEERASLEHKDLVRVLSTGEKKALYILNLVFEIEVRKKKQQETLFVVDDVADSFDYKNKYAIIQYLKDIGEEPYFYQIILTHNFDFFRTIQSRSLVRYSHCMMAYRLEGEIQLKQAEGIKNPFILDWKPNFFTNDTKKVACIPFMRNLIEYTKGNSGKDYSALTSLLHWRNDSGSLTEDDLHEIFRDLFGLAAPARSARLMISIIEQEAATCLKSPDGISLETKVVLAIATRLAAERFMLLRIADASLLGRIDENQTQRLLREFKTRFPGDSAFEVLDRVILMTPENIHLNSFMYEPILDMSSDHLKRLYSSVLALT